MDYYIKDFNVKLKFEDNTRFLTKEEFLSLSTIEEDVDKDCLFLLQDPSTELLTIFRYLGEMQDKSQMKKYIKKVIKEHAKKRFKLKKYQNIKSTVDERNLEAFIFKTKSFEYLVILNVVNQHIFSVSCPYKKGEISNSFGFNFDIIKSIFPVNA